ncbi:MULTISPECIES: hypothetical protein [Serratia]|uniref:hypothetical protein n=1 Tax=Serratia TaxID=613 RepID=UPI0021C5EA9E|nr:hypothetical protein [Serratia liquefaciens]
MVPTYTWSISSVFAKQFDNLSTGDQDCILDFTDIFEAHGLSDFKKYVGKISPSWKGLNVEDAEQKLTFDYAKSNDLWHYHVGLPVYVKKHDKYLTSDWVVHFQWKQGSNHIDIVDMCYHYTADGKFYIPKPEYLAKAG